MEEPTVSTCICINSRHHLAALGVLAALVILTNPSAAFGQEGRPGVGGCAPDCTPLKQNIECLNPSPQYNNRTFVGQLLTPGGLCTAWIVASNGVDSIVMTNEHCTVGQNVNLMTVRFNFQCNACVGGVPEATQTFPVTALITQNAALDYALLRVSGNPAATFGIAQIDPSLLTLGQAIYEIHHAGGLVKGYDAGTVLNLSTNQCVLNEIAVSNLVASGGASGSPIFRFDNHCVAAICNCGGPCQDGFGVPMSNIIPNATPILQAAGFNFTLCGANPPPCDDVNSGDCCIANGTPGCDRKECCAAICAADPFCCDNSWDILCADAANADPVNCPQCVPPPPCPGARIDFGVTPDDNGNTNACPGPIPITVDYVFTQDIVFGTAVDNFSPPPVVITADGACNPSCRSSGDPPFVTDWWCQFRIGIAPRVPGPLAGVTSFSAEVCLVDAPGGTIMNGYNNARLLIASTTTTGPTTEVLTIVAPAGDLIAYVQITNPMRPGGVSVDCLAYPDPIERNPVACDDPNALDCCVGHPDGNPGCDRKECCVAICAIDSFCCDTNWDSLCASEAALDPVNCPQCVPPPCPGARIDFGVTPDDNGNANACPGPIPITVDYVFTQDIVFGTAVDNFGPPPVVITDDGACDPSCRSSGDPPFVTDWWCQFRIGIAPRVPGPLAGVTSFSAEVCLVDAPGGTIMNGYNNARLLIASTTTTGPSTEVLTIVAPPGDLIAYVQITNPTRPFGVSVDCLSYPDPVERIFTGACCIWDGTCVDGTTAAECAALFGSYQGDGTNCAASDCTPPQGANLFTDPAAFQAALLNTDKRAKASWDFKPNFLPPASVVGLDDPLNIDTHGLNPDDPWTDAAGNDLWPPSVDNVTFQSNLGPNPQAPQPNPRGIDGLAFATPGFVDNDNNVLLANFFPDSFDILSGPPTGGGPPPSGDCCVGHPPDNPGCEDIVCETAICLIDPFCCNAVGNWDSLCASEAAINPACDCAPVPPDNHTAMALEIFSSASPGPVFVTVFAKDGTPVGKIKLDIVQNQPEECGDPAAGDCCDPAGNGTPGCDRKECCVAICAIDPFCCDIEWDGTCAAEAAADPVNCPQCAPPGECVGGTCKGGFPDCGDPGCGCITRTDGSGFCTGPSPCPDLTLCPLGDGDCPPGFVCAIDTCCVDPVCVPACGSVPLAPPPPGTLTTFGIAGSREVARPQALTDLASRGGVAGGPIKKTFLGIVMKGNLTIGRVNLFDLGSGAEGISKITVYSDSPGIANTDISGPLGAGFPDGCVDAFDLGVVLGAWCSTPASGNPAPDPPCAGVGCTSPNFLLADLSGPEGAPDGCVDAFDLAKILANWCSLAGGNPCGTCFP